MSRPTHPREVVEVDGNFKQLHTLLKSYKETNGFGHKDALAPICAFFACVITIITCAIGGAYLSWHKPLCSAIVTMATVAIFFLLYATDTRDAIVRAVLFTRSGLGAWKKTVRGMMKLYAEQLPTSTLAEYREELHTAFEGGRIAVPYQNITLYDYISGRLLIYSKQGAVRNYMEEGERLLEEATYKYLHALRLRRLHEPENDPLAQSIHAIAEHIERVHTASVAARHPSHGSWTD